MRWNSYIWYMRRIGTGTLPKEGTREELTDVTLTQVAQSAGVSLSTASRVFSRPGRVALKTRNHVVETAKRLGYNQQIVDAPAVSRLQGFLAAVVTDLENIVSARIARGIEASCHLHKFGLFVLDTQESVAQEAGTIRGALGHVDGLILGSSRLSDAQIRRFAAYKPIVVLNRVVPGIASIWVDESASIDQAVRSLRMNGCRSLSYMQGPENSWQNVVRLRAAAKSARGQGLEFKVLPCAYPCDENRAGVYDSFMTRPTDAVLAFNDDIAISFIRFLHERGIAVPGKVSVVGIDDNPIGRFMAPSLTTIQIPHAEMGYQAAQMLINEILHLADHCSTASSVSTVLIERASTSRAPSHIKA